MTFPWVRVLFMLVIMGGASLAFINGCMLPSERPFTSPPYHSVQKTADKLSLTPELFVRTSIESGYELTSNIDVNNKALPLTMWSKNGQSASTISAPIVSPHISDDLHYVPTYSPRYLSIAQYDNDAMKPYYRFVFEFESPPAPSFTPGYQINVGPQLDWILVKQSSPSRLSGWKESNLLYRQAHQTASC